MTNIKKERTFHIFSILLNVTFFLNKCLLSTPFVPDTVLGACYVLMNKTEKKKIFSTFMELTH